MKKYKPSSRIARRRKIKARAGLVFRISLPFLFLIGLVFLLRADFMQIKDFEVVGAETVSPVKIKNLAGAFASGNKFWFLPRSDILLLDKEKLATDLLAQDPKIEKVEVNKRYIKRNVEILIKERIAKYLWCSDTDECYFMTADGFVFEKTNLAEDLSDKVIFKGNIKGDPLMKYFTSADKMEIYSKFLETFADANFSISLLDFESEDKAVAKTKVGDIIFNPNEKDLSLVAHNSILLIMEVRSKHSSAVFEYIDARFDNKFFYKLR